MNAMTAEAAGEHGDQEGGPMWGRFFESLGHEDTDSVLSGSHIPSQLDRNSSFNLSHVQSPMSEVHPNDSASVVDDEPKNGTASIAGHPSALPVDDGTYVFKFRTPSGRTHRFQARNDSLETLREIVTGKLAIDPFFTDFRSTDESAVAPDPMDFQLSYTDADGDTVLMTADNDVVDAVKNARATGSDRVVLILQGGKAWADAGANKSEERAAAVAAAAKEETKEVEKAEATLPEGVTFTPPNHIHVPEQELVLGMPKDLLLPASIGALAAVILGVFTISRLTRDY